MALCPGSLGWASTRKVKPIWILLKQETVSSSGISWTICKSAPCSRQITTLAPHHSVFYRSDALPAAHPTLKVMICSDCYLYCRWMLVQVTLNWPNCWRWSNIFTFTVRLSGIFRMQLMPLLLHLMMLVIPGGPTLQTCLMLQSSWCSRLLCYFYWHINFVKLSHRRYFDFSNMPWCLLLL